MWKEIIRIYTQSGKKGHATGRKENYLTIIIIYYPGVCTFGRRNSLRISRRYINICVIIMCELLQVSIDVRCHIM